MKLRFKGRAVKENSYMELECDPIKDNYEISQRDMSVVVRVNEKSMFSLKEYFEVQVINEQGENICTTTITTPYKEIVILLRGVMKLYHVAMEMDVEEQERIILNQIISLTQEREEFESISIISTVCHQVLNEYPKGFPHDSTLIDEAKSRLNPTYYKVFPHDFFDRDMLIYGWFDQAIKELFLKMNNYPLERRDQMILEKLERSVHNALVNNPNFKGNNPYYKRKYSEYDRAKRLTLELMDQDFESYIEYFIA